MSGLYEIGERVDIRVVRDSEANFDLACEQAYKMALDKFGCDDLGDLNNVIASDRAVDSVVVAFVSYVCVGNMLGQSHAYKFSAWVSRVDDDGG
jgi:hypothetical protein